MQKSVDIRRNDQVQVITGRDKGKQGRVLRVMPGGSKVLVEHVMMVKKNVRPNPQKNIKGGIAEQESGDRNVRVCKSCGNTLEK
jgi:large subunit ribosomal protein L24